VRPMVLPDRFIGHGSPKEQYEDSGLEARHIVAEVWAALEGVAPERNRRPPAKSAISRV
jgi:deoxyxylulose-5-phosphate synthase